MKYIIVLGDGMADYPVDELGGKTPLQYANKPHIDKLASMGTVGLVKTVADGLKPGSDVANLSVLGYNPDKYYTGRSPLEAASIGIELDEDDITFRCNLVTLSDNDPYEKKMMIDYSSDEVTTEEAEILLDKIKQNFNTDDIQFYPGISYRHCMVWRNGPYEFSLTPPHDISDKCIDTHLPKGPNSSILTSMMKNSYKFLKNHPVNTDRVNKGLNAANSIWLWGEGKKPILTDFFDKTGLKGSIISAVDLVKGIGICANMKIVEVEGATGNIHTNFKGKAQAAFNELKNGQDFVYIHMEAPDECGHRCEIDNKVKAIELIDEMVVKYLLDKMPKLGDFKIMVLPDHPTPLSIKTHTSDPVPFAIYDSTKINDANESGVQKYDEKEAEKTGLFIDKGHELLDYFISELV